MTCLRKLFLITSSLLASGICGFTQPVPNLLLNGGFEDINTCSEYQAECGVEGWFYLQQVKAQMLDNHADSVIQTGRNSYGIFTDWNGYEGFSPVIGTMLPCGLQAGHIYTFSGVLSAKLNPKLILSVGMVAAEKYYVPNRPFTKTIIPQKITSLEPIADSRFFRFTTTFTATGKERYLTFGIYVQEDSISGKRLVNRKETISLIFDEFALTPVQTDEAPCPDFAKNKQLIYQFDARHKTMDYGLYARGEIPVVLKSETAAFVTSKKAPSAPVKALMADTLLLNDVLFDFNKSTLKPAAVQLLQDYFTTSTVQTIDSLVIEGHTDSIGSEASNLLLSQHRSASVQQWIEKNTTLTEHRMRTIPWGKTRPVADNDTPEGRARNRRVEIILFRRTQP